MRLRLARASAVIILLVIAFILNSSETAAMHLASSSDYENQTAGISENITFVGKPEMIPAKETYWQATIDKMQAATDSRASSIAENQTAPSSDNVTDETPETPSDIEKKVRRMRKPLEAGTTVTLSSAQQAEIDRLIQEKKSRIDKNLIKFNTRYSLTIVPGTIAPDIEDAVKIKSLKSPGSETAAGSYYLIQLDDDQLSVYKSTRGKLQQAGCVLYDYLGKNAFYCRIPSEALDTVISLVKSGGVRYLGNIPTEAKIRPEFLAKTQKNPDSSFSLAVLLLGELNQSNIDSLKNYMQVDSYYPVPYIVFGTATGNSINDIAALNFVKWIEEETPATLLSNDGTSAIDKTKTEQPTTKWKTLFSSMQQKIRELWHKSIKPERLQTPYF